MMINGFLDSHCSFYPENFWKIKRRNPENSFSAATTIRKLTTKLLQCTTSACKFCSKFSKAAETIGELAGCSGAHGQGERRNLLFINFFRIDYVPEDVLFCSCASKSQIILQA